MIQQRKRGIVKIYRRKRYARIIAARIGGKVWIRVSPEKQVWVTGFKGSRKSTPYAVQTAAASMLNRTSKPGLRISKKYASQFITKNMVGYKLGEFSPTRTFRGHAVGRKRDFRRLWIVRIDAAMKARAQVSKVVFDRGRFKYHGRVKALADAAREAAREAGLKF